MKRFKRFRFKRYQNQRFLRDKINGELNQFKFIYNSGFEDKFREKKEHYCDFICANNPYLYVRKMEM